MKKHLTLGVVIQRLAGIAIIGIFCLELTAHDSFAHWRPHTTPAPRPSSSPRPPSRVVKPVSMQQLQQRFQQMGIKPTAQQLEKLRGLDDRVLGIIDRIFGNFGSFTPEQRDVAQGWLNNTLDLSGQIQGALDNAEFHNNHAWVVDNLGLAVSITKGGILVIALATNPAAIPVLIAIEGAGTKVEHVGTFAGEVTAALQDGWNEKNVIRGLKNGAVEVSIRLAGGKVANIIFPPGALGRNMRKGALKAAIRAWGNQEGTKVLIGEIRSAAQDLYNSDEPFKPPQSTTRTFTLPQNIPVQTSVTEFNISPEQLEEMRQRRESRTQTQPSPPSQPANGNDPVAQFIGSHLNEQAMKKSIKGYLDTGVFVPPLPAPSAQSVKGNSTTAPETFDNLFVSPRPQVRGAHP
ncbi:MAG: hypothetical protein DRQ56_04510 [Gammaproteobacteria bacterium]|nr:MAG: hypothetical protein DRQ56_04510 [Gammaproteobacteria bacterium]